MNTIIVPTDFSATGANAIDYAIALAKEINAGITLLHVYQVPITITADTPIVVVEEEELRKSAEAHLHTLKMEIEEKTGTSIKVDTELRLGDTVTELQHLGDERKPFAVVMGSNGHSGIEQMLFGSTTLKTIRHLTWPIIAVPPERKYTGIKKTGFASDYKQAVAAGTLEVIKDFLKNFKAEFHVLHVDPENRPINTQSSAELTGLQTALQELNPIYDFIEDENIEQGLSKFAEKNSIDLLIIIPKKHNFLEGLFRKSATKQLVFHAHVPLLCVHE